ncbi:FCD domain-containing protein [Cereibacter sp. SYSU M97828]|nr:FCD domain-containing protein [Cereibacter flavus]
MNNIAQWLADKSPVARQNAAEAVFEDLRSAILSGRIPVSTRLPSEAKLAGKYGVSRPMVREALRSLQTLGLTRSRTGSGSFVISASPAEPNYGAYSARDLIEARPFVEIPAAGWAAIRRSEDQRASLLRLCDRMDDCHDPLAWVRHDSAFHALIAEASGNALFARIAAEAREALAKQSELVNLSGNRRTASNHEHRRIAEAIAAADEAASREAMQAHLNAVEQLVTRLTHPATKG